jgi:hypothetical protein
MPDIDIGMDVHRTEPPVIGGQIILSSPGGPCMRCLSFLTEEKLAREAELGDPAQLAEQWFDKTGENQGPFEAQF